jgi:MFS family permease
MPLSAGAVALVTVLALAVGVPLLLSCRFIQLLLKPPPPAAEVRTPLLSAAVTDAAGAGSTAVYPARWWALLVFVVMSTVQNNMWISFNVVVDPACEFLRVDTSDINFLATLGPLVLIPVAFVNGPLSRSLGLRAVVIIGCALVAVGAVMRILAIYVPNARYGWVVAAHTVNAAAGPVIMCCPPMLSSVWFPVRERTTATAIAYNAQIVGISFGWAAGPYLVTQASEIPRLIWLEAGFGIFALLAGLTFPAAPAMAPTVSAGEERTAFWDGVSVLLRRPSFVAFLLLWGVASGVNWGWTSLLDIYLKHGLSPTQIGWIGFGGNLAGAAGGVLAGLLIDRFDHSLKLGMVALYAGATFSAVAFLLFVYVESSHLEMLPIFLSVVCQGFFANAAAPVALEMAAETTYPVGEETSATLLVVFFAAIMVGFIQFSDVISPVAMVSDAFDAPTCLPDYLLNVDVFFRSFHLSVAACPATR